MELWILLALVVGGLAAGMAARIYTARRRAPERNTKNIYPLW
jgi:hypothetical protein